MKRLLVLSLLGTSFFIGCKSIKADQNYFLNHTSDSYEDPTYEILKSSVTGDTNQTSLITTFNRSLNNNVRFKYAWIDHSLNKIFFQEVTSSHSNTGRIWTYSISDDNWTVGGAISSNSADEDPTYQPINSNSYQAVQSNSSSISTNSTNISSNDTDIATNASNISSNNTDIATNASNISSNNTDIATNASNISSNDTDIATNASNISSNNTDIATNASNISSNDTDIATNASNISSNNTDIATNASNISSNDTDIATNASNISSNDTDIATNASNISTNTSNIKNLGQGVAGSTALTAALTALPQTSKESKLSCGVGSGAYSGRYAVGFGCASKVSKRVDINAGGSYVFGGSKSYGVGTLDSGVVKAGFVFKLGELNIPTQISMKDKKVMETKIETLEEKNKKILTKNQKLENKLSLLMARLEKIEKIALGESKSQNLAVYQLK